jgi:hypothetical protein
MLIALATPAAAQQVLADDIDVSAPDPDYAAGAGPRVGLSSGHGELNTLATRYRPFGQILANDGYRISDFPGAFTAEALAAVDVLVVSNPTPTDEGNPPFTVAEAAVLHAWVEGGGSLLLIVDHAPMADAVPPLAEAFGLSFEDGFVVHGGTPEIFARADGTLGDHPITRGEGGGKPISQVRAFTGSAFRAPPGAAPLMTLDKRWKLVPPSETVKSVLDIKADTQGRPVDGWLQGAAFTVGKGRVVVIGEAAMFNAQLIGPTKRKAGFNAEGAEQNKQFLRNILLWLRPKG